MNAYEFKRNAVLDYDEIDDDTVPGIRPLDADAYGVLRERIDFASKKQLEVYLWDVIMEAYEYSGTEHIEVDWNIDNDSLEKFQLLTHLELTEHGITWMWDTSFFERALTRYKELSYTE